MRCRCRWVTPREQSINTLSLRILAGVSAPSSALPLPLARFDSCLSWISFEALSNDAMVGGAR